MEELTVVYFLPDEAAAGKKKRRGEWSYHTEQTEVKCGSYNLPVVTVYLPVFSRKRKPWKKEEWQSYCSQLPIPEESSRVRYYWQEKAGEMLGRVMEPLSFEWITFLLTYYQVTFTELVVLDDRDMPTEELVRFFVSQTRNIKVVTNDREQYEDLGAELYEEYGFLLSVAEDARELRLKDRSIKEVHTGYKASLLIIAGKNLYHITPAMIPESATWFCTEAEGLYEKKISARVRDSKVIGMQSFWKDLSKSYKL